MTINRFLKRILFYLIPVFVVCLIILFLKNVYDVCQFSEEDKILKISTFFQTVIPFIMTWWIVVMNKNIIHDEGNELYKIYISGGDSLISHLVLMVCFFPVILICYTMINTVIVHLDLCIILSVTLETFCLSSVAYMLNYTLSNVGIGLILVGLYSVGINYIDTLGVLRGASIYMTGEVFNSKGAVICIIIGIMSSVTGAVSYSLKTHYN